MGCMPARDVRRLRPASAAALTLVLLLSALASCSSGENASTTADPPRASTAPDPTTAPPSEPAPMKVVRGKVLQRIPLSPAQKLAKLAQKAAATSENPLVGRPWGVYNGPADQASAPYASATGDRRALLAKIALRPKAQWFGDWIGDGEIAGKVRDYIATAQAGDPEALVQMAVFRMSPWEHEACRRLPSAGEQASYRSWIDSFAGAVGDTPAAIVLQPDGPFALCVPGGSTLPSSLVAYAAKAFGALPRTSVYIDAGAGDWPEDGSQGGVDAAVGFLLASGIQDVRGIALNSTHYSPTADEVERGAAIVEELAARGVPGKHVVVNTSSNGRGFEFGSAPGRDPDNATVCASRSDDHCVTLGIPPTTDVADPAWGLPAATSLLAARYVDAYLWFGRPWLYRQADPFDLGRALQLAATTPY